MLLRCEVSDRRADSEDCAVFPSIYTTIAFCDTIIAIELTTKLNVRTRTD